METKTHQSNIENPKNVYKVSDNVVVLQNSSNKCFVLIEQDEINESIEFGNGLNAFIKALKYAEYINDYLLYMELTRRVKRGQSNDLSNFCPTLYYAYNKMIQDEEHCDHFDEELMNYLDNLAKILGLFPEITFNALNVITKSDIEKLLNDIKTTLNDAHCVETFHKIIFDTYVHAIGFGIVKSNPAATIKLVS